MTEPHSLPTGNAAQPAVDDCFRPTSPMMSHGEVLALLRERVQALGRRDVVTLGELTGRVTAEAVMAPSAVPPCDNSAVDGYAFRYADYDRDRGVRLPVVGIAAAGRPFSGSAVPVKSALRVLTGAVLPKGVDSVAMQEDCRIEPGDGGEAVDLPPGLSPGKNIRRAGEDVAEGSVVVTAGTRLRPQDVAQLASLGVASAVCYARPRVAIVSTGDEVVRSGSGRLDPGKVYDANAPMLAPMVRAAGGTVEDLGVWRDDRQEVLARLADAAARFDVILTSGGASTGDEDHMAAALAALGQRHVWRLAIKPGRPLMFGQIGAATVVGLPGNPVAVFVCFLMYVHPLLALMGGERWREPLRIPLPARFSIAKRKVGRREFLRGILVRGPDGLGVDRYPRDGSGLITGLRVSDGLIDIPEETAAVAAGDPVSFIPYSAFGIG